MTITFNNLHHNNLFEIKNHTLVACTISYSMKKEIDRHKEYKNATRCACAIKVLVR